MATLFLQIVMLVALCCLYGFVPSAEAADPLIVSSLLVPPFLSAVEYKKNGSKFVRYEGYIQDLMDEVSTITKKPFEIKINTEARFGHLLPNGTWDGLIGDVVSGRADLAAGPLTETASRSKAVDFSTPFMNFGPVIILRRPEAPVMTLEERLQRLFSPLSQSVWMLSGLAWLVTSFVLYIICHFNPYDWRRLCKDRQATLREGESFSCLNTFWFTMSNLLWQGYTRSPRSMGGRVVVTFWWTYVMIFIIMYIASMTNYLRVGPTQEVSQHYTSIQSIEDLGQQSVVEYGVLLDGSTEQYLGNSKLPFIKRVWSMINELNTQVATLELGIEKVRSSRKPFALIAESAMAKFYTKQSPCDIYMVGDFTTIGSYSLAFPAKSSLVKEIDVAILMLRETGVLKQLEDRWFTGECTDFVMEINSRNRIEIPPFYRVDLGSFSGALIILGIGLVIGSLITVLEVFVFKYAEVGEKPRDESGHPLNSSSQSPQNASVLNKEPEPITDV